MQKGFTLIEIMVALAVFVFVVAGVSGLFVYSLKLQRSAIAYQQLLDQTSYLMEYMSKAVRMAKKDIGGSCTDIPKLNYVFSGNCLKFVNYKDGCQEFCLSGGRIINENNAYLTGPELTVNNFNVVLSGETQNDDLQPKVTIFLDISGPEGSDISIQTTISQRNLDVRR